MNKLYNQTDWFIVSKFEDDSFDYRILAGSINDQRSWERRFLSWRKAQVPESESNLAPAEPWYYFIPEEIDGELCQIVIKQSWTNYYDKSRRKVLNSICLIFPFSILQTEPSSFFHLSELFIQHDVANAISTAQENIKRGQFLINEPKISFSLPEEEKRWSYFSALQTEFGLNYSSYVANCLCQEKKVCLIDSESPITSIEKRLQMLDAALIAVPYGSRATISSASWHYGSSDSVDSLVVGRYPSKGAVGVKLDNSLDLNDNSHLYSFHINEAINRGYSEDDIVSEMFSITDITNLVEYTPYFPQKYPPVVIREHDISYEGSHSEQIDTNPSEEESNLIPSLTNQEVAGEIEQSNILIQFEEDNNNKSVTESETLFSLANEIAQTIILEFDESSPDAHQVWQNNVKKLILNHKVLNANNTMRLLLLVLGCLENASLRKETAYQLLPQLYQKLKENDNNEDLPIFHQYYSEFVHGILKNYKEVFKDERMLEEWLNFFNILFS